MEFWIGTEQHKALERVGEKSGVRNEDVEFAPEENHGKARTKSGA